MCNKLTETSLLFSAILTPYLQFTFFLGEAVTRSKNKVKFKNKFTNITKVQNSPYYRGIFLWDQLPVDLQLDPDLKSFKNGVRSLIRQDMIKYFLN